MPVKFKNTKITGQVVLITAGAAGIGRTIAESFLARGCSVHVCDIDQQAIDEFLSANQSASASLADVSSVKQVESLFTELRALYGRLDVLETLKPYQGGGDMILSVSFEKTTFNELPYRLEAGTPNVAGVVGLGAAADYLTGIGMDRIQRHDEALCSYAVERLGAIAGLRIIGTPRQRAGVVSFVLDGVHPHDIGTILDQKGIAVRTGHHCAQPLMDRFGVPATARASFSFYNTLQEVDALCDGLQDVAQYFN